MVMVVGSGSGAGSTGVNVNPQYRTITIGDQVVRQVRYGDNGTWITQSYYNANSTGTASSQKPTSGGSTGGGGYSTPSKPIDYSATGTGAYNQLVIEFTGWMGIDWVRKNSAIIRKAFDNQWTNDQIRRQCVGSYGGMGSWTEGLYDHLRAVAGPELSDAWIRNIIANGYYEEANFEDIRLPQLAGAGIIATPQAQQFIEMWNDYTAGADFNKAAQDKLVETVQKYGWSGAMAMWEQYLPTTNEAVTGNYGAIKRETIQNAFMAIMHRAPTAEELDAQGPYWDMLGGSLGNLQVNAFVERLRLSDEYKEIYKAKPPEMTEQQYWATVDALNSVGNWYFNRVPGQGGTPDQIITTDSGVQTGVDPNTGLPVATSSTSVTVIPGTPATGFTGYTQEELAALIREGWSAEELQQHYKNLEDAIFAEGASGDMLKRTLGVEWTTDQWYALVNNGQGSGELRLQLMEAQNREDFRLYFKEYTGREPSVTEYEYLTSNFVNPTEYTHRMAAKESAAEQIDQINEVLRRVYGTETTVSELENLAMNGEGSGALRAEINQAMRLDQYRDIHFQYYGTEPTPDQYAWYAGYPSTATLQWELKLTENMDEFGPEIQEAWKSVYGEEISDDEIKTMLGDMKGSGELKYKYKEAKEQLEEKKAAGLNKPQANQMYGAAQGGGFKVVMGGLQDL